MTLCNTTYKETLEGSRNCEKLEPVQPLLIAMRHYGSIHLSTHIEQSTKQGPTHERVKLDGSLNAKSSKLAELSIKRQVSIKLIVSIHVKVC